MKYSRSTPYLLLARSIGVTEIADPPTLRVSPETSLGAVLEELSTCGESDPWCLVRDEQRVYGWLVQEDDVFFQGSLDSAAGEEATPIIPEVMLSASTSLLELPALFLKHYCYFVLTGNEITHLVSFQDMDRLPMRLCLFSLVMQLESKLLELLSIDWSSLERYLACLPPARLKKAQDLCREKYKHETPPRLLLCTTFVDKKQLLRHVPGIMSKLPFHSKNEIDQAFKRIETVRNQIAHGDSVMLVLSSPEKFSDFIDELQGIIAALSAIVEEKIEEWLP